MHSLDIVLRDTASVFVHEAKQGLGIPIPAFGQRNSRSCRLGIVSPGEGFGAVGWLTCACGAACDHQECERGASGRHESYQASCPGHGCHGDWSNMVSNNQPSQIAGAKKSPNGMRLVVRKTCTEVRR